MTHLALVFGTRPEIIKLAPVIRAAKVAGIQTTLIHTNQHYSRELDAVFFEELELPAPNYNLEVGSGTQAQQTAKCMERLEPILLEIAPSYVVVQGDTNAVLAGALTASKLNIPVAHIEAGLRSYDRAMPEEINRIITDHISTQLFPPTQPCADTLVREGISTLTIHTVGNTIVDAVLQGKELAKSVIPSDFGVEAGRYLLCTLHRPSNVDTKESLAACLTVVRAVQQETGLPVLFPAHPRTKGNLARFSLTLPEDVVIMDPVGYRAMIWLQQNARMILTDSGGIQEEACILGTPCVTLRDTTERPETVSVGASILAHHDTELALKGLQITRDSWENPFGDGTAGEQIVAILSAR